MPSCAIFSLWAELGHHVGRQLEPLLRENEHHLPRIHKEGGLLSLGEFGRVKGSAVLGLKDPRTEAEVVLDALRARLVATLDEGAFSHRFKEFVTRD